MPWTRLFIASVASAIALPACEGTSGPLLEFVSAGGSGLAGSESTTDPGGASAPVLPEVSWRRPPPQGSFQIQLSDELSTSVAADVFVLDLDSPDESDMAALVNRGAYLSCYFSASSFEPWRPDAESFPDAVKGSALPDYPSENWLNIADARVLSLLQSRMSAARERGCSAVYPSIVRPSPGNEEFGLTEADYESFSNRLTDAAHELDLAVFLGSDGSNLDWSSPYDAVLVFGCQQAQRCEEFAPLAAAGRAIFQVEFADQDPPASSCPPASPWPTIVKNRNFDAFLVACDG